MSTIKGGVRSSQLITTYGIGAIVALKDESFMVAGLDRWSVDEPDLYEARLQRALGVRGFVRPPATDDRPDIPVVRFPSYHFCPDCHRLDHHRSFGGSWQEAKCANCDAPLVPARFVMACLRGHIDDFPWFKWVHAGAKTVAGTKHTLLIKAAGATSSLADVEVRCSCGQSRSLDGAFGKFALRGITRCTGRRPWITGSSAEECDEVPRALQRGASNVWFSIVRSAISIPPWSEGAYQALDHHWRVLQHLTDPAALRGVIAGMGLAERTGISADDLVEAVTRRQRQEAGEEPPSDLKTQEHEALIRGRHDDGSLRQQFVCEPVDRLDDRVAEYFEVVSKVTRLREVRVLEAFTRILPPDGTTDTSHRVSVMDTERGLLPGIEVIGEGVFLEFDQSRVQAWESRADVQDRARVIQTHLAARCDASGTPRRSITPRLLLGHSFAHALINQWSLECGYSASALRERLYVSADFLGVLIYTATSDSAGSLGGIVSQATPQQLFPGLRDAIRRASWCSSDPLCIETDSQGTDALNLGACHSCLLLPETSCEEANVFLDRGMLVGTPHNPTIGFFTDWVG